MKNNLSVVKWSKQSNKKKEKGINSGEEIDLIFFFFSL